MVSITATQAMDKRNGNRIRRALGRVGLTPLGVGLLVVLAVLPLVRPFSQEHVIRWLITAAFLAAQAAAFDFTSGYINVVNFGFAAFVGLGAYVSAILANESPLLIVQPGISPWIGMWIGALASGLLGLGLGVLTLRLRGIFAACMAWFLGIGLLGTTNNLVSLTRGALGLHPPRLLDTAANLPYYYVILVMMIVTYVCLRFVTNSRMGLIFRAIGQNIDAAKASGINPTKYKVMNFALSCLFAGWLGGFYAHYLSSLTPSTVMHTSKTVEVLTMVYIGGRGSMWGGMAIAFPFVFSIEFLRSTMEELPGIHLVIFGVLMILVMIFYPGGFSSLWVRVTRWLSGRLTSRSQEVLVGEDVPTRADHKLGSS